MKQFMQKALESALIGVRKKEGGPFGACIVKGRRVLAVTHNTVLKNRDATCHAEVSAIRLASKKMGTWNLEGCKIYSTTEPCPMCFSAIHWARIREIYYGTSIEDVARLGFNELAIHDSTLNKIGKSGMKIHPRYLRKECIKVLEEWQSVGGELY